jgi:hypothetical protein
MSEWLLLSANSAIIQQYQGESKLFCNEMMMRSASIYTNTLSWIILLLAHWNNSSVVDMSLHSDTLSWFRANQSLFFLLNDVCLAEKQHIPMLVFGLTRLGIDPTIYRTRGEHANHYASDAVCVFFFFFCVCYIVFPETQNTIRLNF